MTKKTQKTAAEIQGQLRRQATAEAEDNLFERAGVLAGLHSGSPGSYGDAGLGGRWLEDGTFEGWFSIGDGVGGKPVRPATRA